MGWTIDLADLQRLAAAWPYAAVAAAAVVLIGLLLAIRGLRRSSAAQLRKRLVFTIGGAGAAVAAYGTVRALHAMGQPWPIAFLSSAAIEGGMLALAFDLYDRARNPDSGRSVARPRLASWAFAAASSWANMAHPPPGAEGAGVVVFGLIPILSLYLVEYQAHTERTGRGLAEAGSWPTRVAAAAWRRTWTGAATWLGLDVDASDTQTEQELAIRKAAFATLRLRHAAQAATAAPGRRTERRLHRATRRAQAARMRAGVATEPRNALLLAAFMRELVCVPADAVDDWSDVAAAAGRIHATPLPPAGAHDVLPVLSAAPYGPVSGVAGNGVPQGALAEFGNGHRPVSAAANGTVRTASPPESAPRRRTRKQRRRDGRGDGLPPGVTDGRDLADEDLDQLVTAWAVELEQSPTVRGVMRRYAIAYPRAAAALQRLTDEAPAGGETP